jgi:hypothetical protein
MQPAAHSEARYSPALLNLNELTSITAVAAYVAYTHKIDEATVLAVLTTAFGVTDVKDMASEDYDAAIRFLVDFSLDEAMN